MRDTLFMETTKVEDTQTVAEIQELLAAKGASSIMVEYANCKVVSVSFQLIIENQTVPFRLPCRWHAVQTIIKRSGKRVRRNDTIEDWARRVAWRQILRWVQAQLALIETGMVKPEEVFLPYAIVRSNDGTTTKTMYDVIAERKFLALPSPKPEENP